MVLFVVVAVAAAVDVVAVAVAVVAVVIVAVVIVVVASGPHPVVQQIPKYFRTQHGHQRPRKGQPITDQRPRKGLRGLRPTP